MTTLAVVLSAARPADPARESWAADKEELVAALGVTSIVRMAFVDQLTSIPNRHRLAVALERRKRAERETVFVRVDLNGFKKAQDRPGFGHEWGDRCLRDFAQFVESNVRLLRDSVDGEGDMLAGREGGDEFLVITSSYAGAGRIAGIVGTWSFEGAVTASVGIGATVQAADAALYAAKAARRRPGLRLPRRLRLGLSALRRLPTALLGLAAS